MKDYTDIIIAPVITEKSATDARRKCLYIQSRQKC